jgi:hypothetical protein
MHKEERQAGEVPRPATPRQVLLPQGPSPTTGSSMKPSPSGSGTSTSGGSDANGDQGRDKMPDSSQGVRPLDKQNKPDKM